MKQRTFLSSNDQMEENIVFQLFLYAFRRNFRSFYRVCMDEQRIYSYLSLRELMNKDDKNIEKNCMKWELSNLYWFLMKLSSFRCFFNEVEACDQITNISKSSQKAMESSQNGNNTKIHRNALIIDIEWNILKLLKIDQRINA